MKRTTLLSVVFIFTIRFSSFANSNPKDDPKFTAETINEDEAVIYLYRLKNMVGGAVACPIFLYKFDTTKSEFLEKQKIGKLKQKQYMPIKIKANTMYYIEIGTMQKIIVSGTEKSNIMVELNGGKIKVTAKDNYATVKLGAGKAIATGGLVDLLVSTAVNKSNEKKFIENKFTLLEPIENNAEYIEMQKYPNCLVK
jgi:hypothetical protein